MCKVVANAGQEFCPRHMFLNGVREQEQVERERTLLVNRKIVKQMPHTRRELIEQGYQSIGNGVCSGCNAQILWWRTPNGNNAPYNPMDDATSPAVSHFATCPAKQAFRRQA